MSSIDMIVAYDSERGIGKDNDLLWRPGEMSADMAFFKSHTQHSAIVMGRNTFESIGRPLPNRRNVVVSRKALAICGVEVVPSIDAAIKLTEHEAQTSIIGGAQLYEAALEYATRIHATEVEAVLSADTFFPPLTDEWEEVSRLHISQNERNIYASDRVVYERTIH